MSRLERALVTVLRDLGDDRVPVALVGGLAVSAHAEPRFTRDIDLAIAVAGDPQAEVIVRALTGRGYRVLALIEHAAQQRIATVRLAIPSENEDGVVADLLFASSGIEGEIVGEAESLEVFERQTLPVAQVGHLAVLKLLSSDPSTRPQDVVDLRSLRVVATERERLRADAGARLVEARGFARGRDLVRAVAEWWRGASTETGS